MKFMKEIIRPNNSEVKKCVEFLKTCDLKAVSEDLLFKNLEVLLTGITINAIRYNSELILYRGIEFSNKPIFYSELIYPPKDKAKQNRASGKDEQMFYCSNLKKAPFYELFVQAGDKLVLSTWSLKKQALFNNIGYTKSNLKLLGSDREVKDGSHLNNIPSKEVNVFIENIIGELFCKKILPAENYYYNLTNAIAKKFLFADVMTKNYKTDLIFGPSSDYEFHDNEYNESQQFPGLVYPTIQNDGIADNFAIKREAIDDNILQFEKAEYIEVADIKDNKYKYKIIDIAFEIKDSKIEWKNLNKQWFLFDETDEINFVEENGIFEAYSSNGDLLESV